MHNRAAIAAIAPRSRSSRRDRGAIANKFLQGLYKATGQWREQTRGQTRQLGERRMHPAQEPQLASDMRHHVCLLQELGGLWIVESLATSGLYGMII